MRRLTVLWILIVAPVPCASLRAAPVPQEAEAPKEPDPTPFEKALAAFRKGDYGMAVAEASEVAADDPLFHKARYLLGESWLALKEFAEAEKEFRALLKSRPESVPVLTGLARSLAGLGKFEDAEALLRKALRLEPRDPAPRRALGECLAADGKPREARKELEAATKLDPRDPLTARLLVEITVSAGDTSGASKAAEAFRRADPKHPLGDFLLGLVQDRIGDVRAAVESYEAALAKDPKFLDAHKNLAILLVGDNPGYKDVAKTKRAFAHLGSYFELGGEDENLRKAFEKIRGFLDGREK